MKLLSGFRTLLDYLFRRRHVEGEMEEELRSHLQNRADDLVRQGLTREEAERQARVEFGGYERHKEECRDALGSRLLEELIADVRYGLRQLRRSPGFTVVAIITLALGIGANTAIFSLIDSLLLRPLPVSNPDEVVELWAVIPNGQRSLLSYPMASEIARESNMFSNISAWSSPAVPLEVDGESTPGGISQVEPEYFQILRTRPLIGRLFGPKDFRSGEAAPGNPVVISYGVWRARYGGRSDIVGKTLRVNGHPYTIIGVTPQDFFGPMVGVGIDAWVPLGPPLTSEEGLHNRQGRGYWLTARLKAGVSVAKAQAGLEVLWPAILQSTAPAELKGEQREEFLKERIRVQPAAAGFLSTPLLQFERPLRALMAAVGLLLLIACVNLASLLIARSATRLHEMGIRSALGAGRWRLARQVMIEGGLLSVGAAAVSLPLALVTSSILARLAWTGWFPVAINLRPDWRIFAFTTTVACLTGVLLSLLPAWHASRKDPSDLIRCPTGTSQTRGGIWTAGKMLITVQVAFSLVLMEGASLFSRNLAGLRSIDLGFEPHQVVGLLLQPKPGGYRNFNAASYYQTLIDELAHLPGVRSVSLSTDPISRVQMKWAKPVWRGPDVDPSGSAAQADEHKVSPEFFRTMRIPIILGREFRAEDNQHAPAVSIVSQSLAERLFPAGDAVGQSITVTSEKGNRRVEIVGVAKNANLLFVRNQRPLAYYLPWFQQPDPCCPYVEIKAYGDPSAVVTAARKRTESLGREYIFVSETLDQAVDNTLVNDRVLALFSGVFGVLAVLMVAIGLYSLISYSVSGRTAEIGVRMALGAGPISILRLILSSSLRLIVIGAAIGLPVALTLSRLVSGLLFNLSPRDPVAISFAGIAVFGAAVLAAYLPARRATKVDPMVALRYE